jgi:transcription elongation factor SPT5
MAGYIYVEARRQPDVMTAVDNVNFCYANHVQLIPVNEMPQLLNVKKPKEIKEGSFVRMKRPAKYAGDLAQIVEVEINANEVKVRLVPRIEYGSSEMNGSSAAKRKRPGNIRPAATLFNENEAKKETRYFVPRGKGRYEFHGEDYENGYLIKTFKISAIQLEDVNPTLEEATKFSRGTEDGDETRQELDLSSLAATLKSASAVAEFLPGDMVEIFTGEQKGVKGRAAAVLQDIVSIDVTEGVLHGQKIDAPSKTLRKLFKEGDHVKVLTHSKYHGETGLVLKIKDDRVTLLTDANNTEITVFSKDLRVALDSGGLIGLNKFDLFDLVELDAATVGCVIKVDRETVRVLDQNGSVRTLLPSSISSKLDKKRQTVATDREGTEIRTEDLVKEPGGQNREGEVIHIHRNFLFLMNRQTPENNGVFVVKSSNVQIKSAKGARTVDAPDLTKMNPALMGNAGGSRGAMAPPPKMAMGGRDNFEGKEVLVTRGPQKGLRGRVKDSTSTHLRLELESKPGVHTYPKEMLKMKDGSGQWVPLGSFGGRRPLGGMNPPGMPFGGGQPQRMPVMPAGARTPSGGHTPLGAGGFGGRTPAWNRQDGGRTPGWEREGPRLPVAAGDGGRTPGWQRDGGRTPAWTAAGARMPAWSAGGPDGSRTAYGGGVVSCLFSVEVALTFAGLRFRFKDASVQLPVGANARRVVQQLGRARRQRGDARRRRPDARRRVPLGAHAGCHGRRTNSARARRQQRVHAGPVRGRALRPIRHAGGVGADAARVRGDAGRVQRGDARCVCGGDAVQRRDAGGVRG